MKDDKSGGGRSKNSIGAFLWCCIIFGICAVVAIRFYILLIPVLCGVLVWWFLQEKIGINELVSIFVGIVVGFSTLAAIRHFELDPYHLFGWESSSSVCYSKVGCLDD